MIAVHYSYLALIALGDTNVGFTPSHTDIIMHIDSTNNKIIAIGGNVGHSVKTAEYDLTYGDFAADTKNTFALLKNITDS